MIVGVLGGGQLARMLALAGKPLGLEFVFLCPNDDACAASLGDHVCARFDDQRALSRLAERADVVTYEFENVPLESVHFLAERVPVRPSARALAATQDRLQEKTLCRGLGMDVPAFEPVASVADLRAAVEQTGFPAVLKTRRMGYDGKGQVLVRRPGDLEAAWAKLNSKAAIVEAFVQYERELSVLAVRAHNGDMAFYPLSENVHRDGILRSSFSRPGDPLQARAQAYAQRLLEELDYVGVLALELFQAGDWLLVNEFAPRVHNSGHWTIEGTECSQFENHLRAILGWPLGATGPVGVAAMVNLIGAMPNAAEVLAQPHAHLHDYGKSPRPGRKLGHITTRTDGAEQLQEAVDPLLRLAAMAPLAR